MRFCASVRRQGGKCRSVVEDPREAWKGGECHLAFGKGAVRLCGGWWVEEREYVQEGPVLYGGVVCVAVLRGTVAWMWTVGWG